jgi:hypothetical protein
MPNALLDRSNWRSRFATNVMASIYIYYILLLVFWGIISLPLTIKYPHLVRLVCRIPPHPPRLFQQLHSTARSPGRVGRCDDFADGQGDLKGPQPPWRMIDSVDIIIIWLVVFFKPSWKIMKNIRVNGKYYPKIWKSVGMIILPYILENKIDVPNHQLE